MLAIYDQIDQLRLELAHCFMTRDERAQARAELETLIAEQAELDRAFDASLDREAPPD